MVDDIIRDEKITVDWTVQGMRKSGDYVESWRIRLWDKAFTTFFVSNESKAFIKRSIFKEFPGTAAVVKRVVYRCVTRPPMCKPYSQSYFQI